MDVLIFLQPLLSGEGNQLGGPIPPQPHPENEEESRGAEVQGTGAGSM